MYPTQSPAQPGGPSDPFAGGATPYDPTMPNTAVVSPTIVNSDGGGVVQPVQSPASYGQQMSPDVVTQPAATQQPIYQQYQAAMPAFMQASSAQPQPIQPVFDPLMQQTAPVAQLDPLADVTMGENPHKSYIVALALAYFVGTFGADRFYLGRTRTAIAKLLTLGGFGVWALVDFLLVGLGRLRAVDDPRPLEGFAKEEHWAKMVVIILTAISVVAIIGFLILVMMSVAGSLQSNTSGY